MHDLLSLAEAAAISEVSADVIRTALEKNAIRLSRKQKRGKAVRHRFAFEDVFLLTLLAEFPFPLSKRDKIALQSLIRKKAKTAGPWYLKGPDFVFRSGDITIIVECKAVEKRLAQNLAVFRRGDRHVTTDPAILGGTPVFRGTRIPVDHIVGLLRKGVSEQSISQDYPGLDSRDLAYARLLSVLPARPGRPRKSLQVRRKQKAA